PLPLVFAALPPEPAVVPPAPEVAPSLPVVRPASAAAASTGSREVNLHQLKLNSASFPPVNFKYKSCTPAAPLTPQDTVVQLCAAPVFVTAQVPTKLPSSASSRS